MTQSSSRCHGYRDGKSGCRDCCGSSDFSDGCVVSCMAAERADRCDGSKDGNSGCRDCWCVATALAQCRCPGWVRAESFGCLSLHSGTDDYDDPCVESCMDAGGGDMLWMYLASVGGALLLLLLITGFVFCWRKRNARCAAPAIRVVQRRVLCVKRRGLNPPGGRGWGKLGCKAPQRRRRGCDTRARGGHCRHQPCSYLHHVGVFAGRLAAASNLQMAKADDEGSAAEPGKVTCPALGGASAA